jgi:hypothetical protein
MGKGEVINEFLILMEFFYQFWKKDYTLFDLKFDQKDPAAGFGLCTHAIYL